MTRSEHDTKPAAPAGELPPIHESLLPREHALHRPRHGRRQRVSLTCAVVFFLVPALAFVFGVRPQEFENHRLAAFPSTGAGWGFFTGLSNWATDNLPLRQFGVRAENGISGSLFGEAPVYSGTGRQAAGAPVGPVGQSTPQQQSPAVDYSQVIVGSNGWLYYAQDLIAKCAPDQPVATTVGELAQLRTAVEASGRSMVLVVVPDKTTEVPQYLPADYPNKDCATQVTNQFWSAVTSTAGAIDLRAGLNTLASMNHQLAYYPADTHWSDEGALYLVRAVAETITPGITRTWRSSPAAVLSGPGDLSRMVGGTVANHDQTYHLSPDGTADRTGRAYTELNQPTHFGSAPTTGVITGSVAVLGDSFLLPATRYLPAVFGDATAIDYGGVASAPGPVIATMVNARTIVIEVVERNLTAGTAPFLQPQVIGSIRAALASHPMR
ncbi:MAG TPA: hypothetical protein VGL06_05395 [Pseudonocardiaceae bacterium]